MAGYTFEYALRSYNQKPKTFNKALMFFSCTDFLFYTLLANYENPEEKTYDPNLIRAEIGYSKEMMLSLVMAKSLINTYRMWKQNTVFAPMIWVDKESASFVVRFVF